MLTIIFFAHVVFAADQLPAVIESRSLECEALFARIEETSDLHYIRWWFDYDFVQPIGKIEAYLASETFARDPGFLENLFIPGPDLFRGPRYRNPQFEAVHPGLTKLFVSVVRLRDSRVGDAFRTHPEFGESVLEATEKILGRFHDHLRKRRGLEARHLDHFVGRLRLVVARERRTLVAR